LGKGFAGSFQGGNGHGSENWTILVAAGAVSAVGTYFLADKILRKWAGKNVFELLEKKCHYFNYKGPFDLWTTSNSQVVYSVRIRDRQGNERTGWVRCGTFLGGVFFSNKAEVRWDQPDETSQPLAHDK
jgi:uncharacterized protein YcfJ